MDLFDAFCYVIIGLIFLSNIPIYITLLPFAFVKLISQFFFILVILMTLHMVFSTDT